LTPESWDVPEEASFSTGSEFIADGGMLLGPVPEDEHATS